LAHGRQSIFVSLTDLAPEMCGSAEKPKPVAGYPAVPSTFASRA
jgi:hypothetical protein